MLLKLNRIDDDEDNDVRRLLFHLFLLLLLLLFFIFLGFLLLQAALALFAVVADAAFLDVRKYACSRKLLNRIPLPRRPRAVPTRYNRCRNRS